MYTNIVFILSFQNPNNIIDDLIFRVSAFIACRVGELRQAVAVFLFYFILFWNIILL